MAFGDETVVQINMFPAVSVHFRPKFLKFYPAEMKFIGRATDVNHPTSDNGTFICEVMRGWSIFFSKISPERMTGPFEGRRGKVGLGTYINNQANKAPLFTVPNWYKLKDGLNFWNDNSDSYDNVGIINDDINDGCDDNFTSSSFSGCDDDASFESKGINELEKKKEEENPNKRQRLEASSYRSCYRVIDLWHQRLLVWVLGFSSQFTFQQ
ncbi:hypothetical protein Glove_325g30 [Diversispora epigaea]|uniref:Uncharacterized protein n=1 Tax=Diversispora epigaea TaxID=1348612 RepID=A0A397HUX9_9GLOM|nr:hypothetical protein Glove_325g30 [Diversispora epigaea]